MRLYKNGKLIGMTDYLDRINGSTVGWLAIGANLTLVQEEGVDPYFAMDEAYPQAFSGSIDDLALWHVARGADEIESIYEKGVAGSDVTKAFVTIPDFVEPGEIVESDAPTSSLVRNGDGTVTYTGTLQSAATASGPWEDVAGATSSLTVAADAPATFARSRN